MPRPFTVSEPSELLARCFEAWPDTKKSQVRRWLKFQAITVNGRPVPQFNHPLRVGDEVAVRNDRFAVPHSVVGAGIRIFFEDSNLLVVEKPSGLLSIAGGTERERTAYRQLTDHVRRGNTMSSARVWIVHRLDRETSGLMVFAKTPEAKEILQGRWEEAEKRYEAVVEGRLPERSGTFECALDESNPFKVAVAPRPGPETRHAVTHYRVLATSAWRTLVELTLGTGRRHQIRVHLAAAGCPVVGDKKYGAVSDPAGRLALHACALRFPHPVTDKEMRFVSPLPKDLARLVLTKHSSLPR